jgi:hypothetical protein
MTADTPTTAWWVPPDTSLITMVDTGFRDLVLPLHNPAALFDPAGPVDPSKTPLSPGRRRTQRAADRIAAGRHPLDDALELHPSAPVVGNVLDPATRRDLYRRPFTCGDCHFIVLLVRGRKRDFKCGRPGAPMSYGPATSIHKWLPGCEMYQPAAADQQVRVVVDHPTRTTGT